jgi:two-component system, chemotaxis family, protein-glutamate methylesterase/glutaminase
MNVSVVVVGTSLGGFSALQVLLSGLPREFRPPIVIVQHRGKSDDAGLARILSEMTPLPVLEPNDKDPLEAGCVYLAPADYHLLIERGRVALSTEGPVNYARPSIDVLFESAADAYGGGVIGVILTGSNNDGARGCARIKDRGGVVLVQRPEDAESGIMPAAAIAATRVDQILPLSEISTALCNLCLEREVAHG